MVETDLISILKKQDRRYWIAVAMKMLHGFGWFLVFPIMPVHAVRLGASALIIGLLMATPAVFQMSIPIVGGTITSHLGKKRIFRWAFATGILSGFVYLVAPHYIWLFIGQVLLGTSHALFEPCFGAHISDLAHPRDTSGLFGFAMGVHALNAMAGPLAAGYLIDSLNSDAVFALYLTLMMFGLAFAYRLPDSDSDTSAVPIGKRLLSISTHDNRVAMLHAGVRFAVFSSWIMFVSWAVFDSFFPMYTENLGHPTRLLGLFLMIRGLSSAIVRFGAGPLVSVFGLRKLISVALLTSSLSFLILPYVRSPFHIIAVVFLSGIAPGVLPVASIALITETLHSRHRPVGMALNQTFVGLGRLTGSSAFGYLTESKGVSFTFTSASLVIALTTGLVAFLNRRTETWGKKDVLNSSN